MNAQQLKASHGTSMSQCSKRATPSSNSQGYSKKQSQKGENSACRAVLPMDDKFCRQCSCYICHQFDDNKDPSLWLVCKSKTSLDVPCGQTCHVECALQHKIAGVVNFGQFMQLDGTYCCTSCGEVSEILGCWKKQLEIAKGTRRVDVLCYRISLSYRLLDGTSKFKKLHQIVEDVKSKLEAEVGPIDGFSHKAGQRITCRLSVADDIRKLCTDAIKKADELILNVSMRMPNSIVDSLPAACRFIFEEITSCSAVIALTEIPTALTDNIKGYKLWYCRSRHETFSTEPLFSFPRERKRISISNLEPSTEYTFRIVPYSEGGELGCSEARCLTKNVDIIQPESDPSGTVSCRSDNLYVVGNPPVAKENNTKGTEEANRSPFRLAVVDQGIDFQPDCTSQNGCLEGFCNADVERFCGGLDTTTKFQAAEVKQSSPTACGLDLNVVSVPDLNEDVTPPSESSRDEQNGCTMERAVAADDDAASHGSQKNAQAKVSHEGASSPNEETLNCNSTLNGSTFRTLGALGEGFEHCVKTVRLLECKGHIDQEFRMKFLTWFSLRCTVEEKRVVNAFVQALADDLKSLAEQLVDSFSDIIYAKRAKN